MTGVAAIVAVKIGGALLGASLSLYPQAALAQNGLRTSVPWYVGLERPLQSSINDDVIRKATEQLGLSEEQQLALRSRMAEHESRFASLIAEWAPRVKQFEDKEDEIELGSSDEWMVKIEREKGLRGAADSQSQLDAQVIGEIRALLRHDQEQKWYLFVAAYDAIRWPSFPGRFVDEGVNVSETLSQWRELADQAGDPLNAWSALEREHAQQICELRQRLADELIRTERTIHSENVDRMRVEDGQVMIDRPSDALLRKIRDRTKRQMELHEKIARVNRASVTRAISLMPLSAQRRASLRYLQRATRSSQLRDAVEVCELAEQALPAIPEESRPLVIQEVSALEERALAISESLRKLLDARTKTTALTPELTSEVNRLGDEIAEREREVGAVALGTATAIESYIPLERRANLKRPRVLADDAAQSKKTGAP